jgi:serine/threonine protein kinase
MSDVFNPYHRWLGIPLQEQPPNHYRLLGLQVFEQDPDVIETAADQRQTSLRLYVDSKHGVQAKALLKEVAEAKVCLLLAERKETYDAWLHERLKSQASSAAGSQLGEYLLEEKLGEGGMGVVYRARHVKLGRTVALKILAKGRVEDPQAIARFEREIVAIGSVNHPHIVQALDAREIDGTRFLVMEYVDGLHLGDILRRCGPLLIPDAAHLVYQAALALQAAHVRGLVHRDIKPSNLMLTATGMVKLLDLGLARFISPGASGDEMTASGQAMGTIDYMAPEQVADSHHVDIRADIYALGSTFYKLLTSQAPFGGSGYGGTLDKLLARIQNDPRPIQELREVPPTLATIIARMLAKNRDDRYATPDHVAAALLPWIKGSDLPALLARARQIDPTHLPPDPHSPAPGQGSSPLPSSRTPPTRPPARLGAAWKVWAKTALATASLLLVLGLLLPNSSRPKQAEPPKTPPPVIIEPVVTPSPLTAPTDAKTAAPKPGEAPPPPPAKPATSRKKPTGSSQPPNSR